MKKNYCLEPEPTQVGRSRNRSQLRDLDHPEPPKKVPATQHWCSVANCPPTAPHHRPCYHPRPTTTGTPPNRPCHCCHHRCCRCCRPRHHRPRNHCSLRPPPTPPCPPSGPYYSWSSSSSSSSSSSLPLSSSSSSSSSSYSYFYPCSYS